MPEQASLASEEKSVRSRRKATPMRSDIQGLRAVAVGIVLLNHLWPHRLTGGYVGVDVFFVISGFLITTHLLQNVPQSRGDFASFWARRVRRLLPAATLVLGVTVVASWIWLPAVQAATAGKEAIAAALYVENWYLAFTATDYFAADAIASPIRHYWSLSVEEQFYLLWPLLIAAAAYVGHRKGGSKKAIGAVISGVIVISLSYSVWLTANDPAKAYFVTTTRMWELAIGGFTAWWMLRNAEDRMSPALRRLFAWTGLAAIVAAAVWFRADTPFPGWTALLPTLGTAFVILAAADEVAWSPRRLWTLPGVRVVGDASYSVYLWHWPLIVIVPAITGETLHWPDKIAIGIVSVLLAVATKTWIEDPVRRNRRLITSTPRSMLMGATLMSIVVASGGLLVTHANAQIKADEIRAEQAIAQAKKCLGAAATFVEGCNIAGEELLTSPDFAALDRPEVYEDDCWNRRPFTSRNVCSYGNKDADKRIALIGNSHAGHWQPALAELAEEHNWRITTYLVSECWSADAPQIFEAPSDTKTCQEWVRWATHKIADGDYDLVVSSNRTWRQIKNVPASQHGDKARDAYAKVLALWTAAGKDVLVLRDVPNMTQNVPDCVQRHGSDTSSCQFPRAEVLPRDPLAEAGRADSSGAVDVLDLTDVFCDDTQCRSIIGGVIVYFDTGHLTATFSRTLVPLLEPALVSLLG